MLVIRLRRIGKKSRPTYRVVVAEHTAAVQGSFVKDLGFYNPHSQQIGINKDEATNWMNKGAKPSNTVAKLLEKEKIKHKSVVVTKYKKAPKKAAEAAKQPAAGSSQQSADSDTVVEESSDKAELEAESREPIADSPATEAAGIIEPETSSEQPEADSDNS